MTPGCPASAAACGRSAGFSLIELLVVMTIVAILLGVGVPNLRSLLLSNRLNGVSNEFMTALQLARSEALRRAGPVSLEPLGGGAGDFSTGWRVVSGATVVRQQEAIDAPLSLRASAATFGTGFVFDAAGRLNGAGIVVLCHGDVLTDGSESRSRALIVDRSGRVRKAALSSTNVPLADGGPITSCTPA